MSAGLSDNLSNAELRRFIVRVVNESSTISDALKQKGINVGAMSYEELNAVVHEYLNEFSSKVQNISTSLQGVSVLKHRHVLPLLMNKHTVSRKIVELMKTCPTNDKKKSKPCLNFHPATFKRMLKNYISSPSSISKLATNMVQYDVEQSLYNLVEQAVRTMFRTGRVTLEPRDIVFVKQVMNSDNYCSSGINSSYRVNLQLYIKKHAKGPMFNMRIPSVIVEQLDDILNVLAQRFVQKADEFADMNAKKTIDSSAMRSGMLYYLRVGFSANADAEIKKALTGENDYGVIPAARVMRIIRHVTEHRVSRSAAVILAAVLDYMCAELLDVCKNNDVFSSKSGHVLDRFRSAMTNDDAFVELLRNVGIKL